ncbi:DUF4287 domain-containing protein [Knoellia sp. S7-12]|uniref:DUF4287 domain-containing protein n=1 Tax=Knoellia sp. S7-12 TaxID=3126698 RepID=UPI003366F043
MSWPSQAGVDEGGEPGRQVVAAQGPTIASAQITRNDDVGHGMALAHVIKNGPGIADTHVGSTGTRRDESAVLRLDEVVAPTRF